MQFILTEEELKARDLSRLPGGGDIDGFLARLDNVCQHVVAKMVESGTNLPNGRMSSAYTHGCIHDEGKRRPTYCDRCPVGGICPRTKEWSK